MPVQSLRGGDRARPLGPAAVAGRRLLVLGAAFAVCAAGAWGMYEVLVVGGLTVLEDVVLVLYVLLFGWIALSFASAVGGFSRSSPGRTASASIRRPRCRRSPAAPRC